MSRLEQRQPAMGVVLLQDHSGSFHDLIRIADRLSEVAEGSSTAARPDPFRSSNSGGAAQLASPGPVGRLAARCPAAGELPQQQELIGLQTPSAPRH
jgi:hypothetical protein